MTQIVSNLGEIGTAAAILTPIDLPLLRNGATWDLTGYINPAIEIWDSRTRTAIATPGTVAIEDAANGIVRWTPDGTNFYSGSFEARVTAEAGGVPEPSGKFRFSLGAGANP